MGYQLEAAISKVFASEAAWFVTDEAIQILGGMGYMKDCGIEKVMRDLRIFRIFEGTNDILRLFVALTGIQYAGGHLRELQKAISSFGQTIEKVLIKHGKNIINEQFILNRLANATIDIYANTCVLSRCSKSISEGLESAHQEEIMTKVWCRQSYDRIMDNLNELKNPEVLDNYKTMAKISEAVCDKNAPVQGNPLGF